MPPLRKEEGSCLQNSLKDHFLIAVFQIHCQLFQACRTRRSLCIWCCPEPEASTYTQESLGACCCCIRSKLANSLLQKPPFSPSHITQQFSHRYEQVHQKTLSVQVQFNDESQSPGTSPQQPQHLLMQLPRQYVEESHETSMDAGRAGLKLFLHKKKE